MFSSINNVEIYKLKCNWNKLYIGKTNKLKKKMKLKSTSKSPNKN